MVLGSGQEIYQLSCLKNILVMRAEEDEYK